MTSHNEEPPVTDFLSQQQAYQWSQEVAVKYPFRTVFFQQFISTLQKRQADPLDVLELGSGPGHLAEQLLRSCKIKTYTMLDFSDAMHELARQRTADLSGETRFITRDLKQLDWSAGLAQVDSIVTLQAVHELRHKKYAAELFQHCFKLLNSTGIFLYADFYFDKTLPDDKANLFMTLEEQREQLLNAGFTKVKLLLNMEQLSLYCAEK